MSQKDMVLSHFKRRKYITADLARDNYGIRRLAAVVKNLRNDGHDIQTDMVPNLGNNAKHARYYMAAA